MTHLRSIQMHIIISLMSQTFCVANMLWLNMLLKIHQKSQLKL